MKRNTPIGCRAFHHTRKVGLHSVCFYCGEKVPVSLLDLISGHQSIINRIMIDINTRIDWSKKTEIKRNYGN